MIKIDGPELSIKGTTVELLTELTVIMDSLYEKDIASKEDLLRSVVLATASDKALADMLVKVLRGWR